MSKDETISLLKRYFGHDALRPGQQQVIEKVLARTNTLAVLPTGGGKSLCYQLPAMVFDGLTLVVSPLIALMCDQVNTLQSMGIAAARWDPSLDETDQEQLADEIVGGGVKILYVSPEAMGAVLLWNALKQAQVELVAIDEAHCVSEWGHRFRPAYLTLVKLVRRLKPQVVLALTATASPEVAREICKTFRILKRDQVQTSFFRRNLHFGVTALADEEKAEKLLGLLGGGKYFPAVVYAIRRETVESLSTMLRGHGIHARAYHAGMSAEARTEVLEGFMRGEIPVMCATIAFGMGVDMPNIRSVIHYQPPSSPEGWMQESGRAGRDGLPSRCEVMMSGQDRSLLEGFLLARRPSKQAVANVLRSLFSQGKVAVFSRYDATTLNDLSREMLDVLLARLELGGWIAADTGSWLWCRAYPLVSLAKVLDGFSKAQQVKLKPLLEAGKRVSLMELSGGTAAGQKQWMKRLAELNASGDVRMNFSHSLDHFKVRKQPEDVNQLVDDLFDVFEQHIQNGLDRVEEVVSIATGDRCIPMALLDYFGEIMPQPCGRCSVCQGDVAGELPCAAPDEISDEELAMIQSLMHERKPALASPERLARFLCGIYSPAMMRYRLYQRREWGSLSRLPYQDVLALAQVQLF
ncbi:RecQ family ATP-dependent DNA helicase [Verrucomicrobiaceae bacterium N1E253]|uniref:ATP-dependent DNA helicase RecQ n=1 Tax=Oceaniferula marina TaxID=2748318 RepID=A0A851GGE5_9BACT|nr:RecQ family ATP-dependent DNA helicase [Oceaniferula marina]NWK56593.1 RecQ family ATP-dependent DNA helicase [Oceaniferula marina]